MQGSGSVCTCTCEPVIRMSNFYITSKFSNNDYLMSFCHNLEMGSADINIPILQMRKLRAREVKVTFPKVTPSCY